MSVGHSRLRAEDGRRYGLRDLLTPRLAQAQRNLQHVLDRIAHVMVKIELLLGREQGAATAFGA